MLELTSKFEGAAKADVEKLKIVNAQLQASPSFASDFVEKSNPASEGLFLFSTFA